MAAANQSPTSRVTRAAGNPPVTAWLQAQPNPAQGVIEGASALKTGYRVGHQPHGHGMHQPKDKPFQQANLNGNVADWRGVAGVHQTPGDNSFDDWTASGRHPPSELASKAVPSHGGPAVGSDTDYEIQHLRTQVKSIGVLHELLADARSETQALHRVVAELEALLKQHNVHLEPDLQSMLSRLRLGSSGSVADTEWSIDLRRPPLSFQLCQTDADARDKITELSRLLEETLSDLRAREEEATQLQALLRASEQEQVREIARLTERLRDSCQDCRTSDAICRSLSGETELLKTRLQQLTEQCQGLTLELSTWKTKHTPDQGQPAMVGAGVSQTPVSLEDQLAMVQRQVEVLDQEKAQMRNQLQEVSRMNKRWQKYQRKQDQVQQELARDKNGLEKKNKALENRCRSNEELLSKLQQQLKRASEPGVAASRDATIRRLEKRVQQLERELTARSGSTYEGDVIQQQLKQFTDDFQKEHTEKERVEREYAMLMKTHEETVQEFSRKLDEGEREIKELKRLLWTNRGIVYPEITRERRELTPHGVSRSCPVFSLGDYPTLPEDVEPDGPYPVTSPSSSPSPYSNPCSPPSSPPQAYSSLGALPRGVDVPDGRGASGDVGDVTGVLNRRPARGRDGDEALQCTRCLREFPVSKHSDFVRHMALCDDT